MTKVTKSVAGGDPKFGVISQPPSKEPMRILFVMHELLDGKNDYYLKQALKEAEKKAALPWEPDLLDLERQRTLHRINGYISQKPLQQPRFQSRFKSLCIFATLLVIIITLWLSVDL